MQFKVLAENEWTDPAIIEEGNHLINVIHAYSERLNLLRYYACQDGIVVNEDSETGFWAFISSVPSFFAGDLVLLDNGNLRVVWTGKESESHLGLQFLGNDMVQYVIFKQRPFSRMVSRVAGRDSFKGIKKQIRTFGLEENLEQVMTSNELLDDNIVVRYAKPSLINEDRITGGVFVLRPRELGLSVNWLDFFEECSKEQQLDRVRETSQMELSRNGRLAELNVGMTKTHLVGELESISFKHKPMRR